MTRNDQDEIGQGPWRLDVKRQLFRVDGRDVRLQPGVLKLLLFLVDHEGQLVSKDELVEAVWEGRNVSDAAIYNRVSALRKAMADEEGPNRCIHWEYGRGLRFSRPERKVGTNTPRYVEPAQDAKAVLQDLAKLDNRDVVSRFDRAAPAEDWRHLLGAYFIMFRTPSWPQMIKLGLSVLRETEGHVTVWTTEHGQEPKIGILQRARYRGYAEYIDDRVFVFEQNRSLPRSVCMTVLDPPLAFRPNIMTGIMLGSSWRLHGAPYSSRVVWSRVPSHLTLRQAIRRSGQYSDDSDEIDESIRSSIGTECLTFHDWEGSL